MNKIITKEYLGNIIEFKMINGLIYANATKMISINPKKRINDWTTSKGTIELIETFSSVTGIPATEFIQTKQGGISKEQGTWIHEKLIIDLAQWIDVKFRVWCNEQIETLLREGSVDLKPKGRSVEEIDIRYSALINLSKLMNLNDSSKASLSNKIVKSLNLGDELILDYVDSKGILLPASDLLRKNNKDIKIIGFNKLLLSNGILEEKERKSHKSKTGFKKYKALTTKGLQYGENQISPLNPKEVQPLYYEDKFEELYKLITK